MLLPKLPVFLIDGLDIAVYPSVEDLLRDVEPIDISNREYQIYDSEGRPLELAVHRNTSFFGGSESVDLIGVESEPIHATELSEALTLFLIHLGVDSGWCRNASLARLEEEVCALLKKY